MAEKTDATPTPEESTITPEQSPEIARAFPVHCKLSSTGAEILVNAEEKAIQFYRCHVPRKFFTLGGATDYAVCGFDEIEAYYVYAVRGKFGSTTPRFCKIVTTSGKAEIREDATGFESLCSWLGENVASNPSTHRAEIPFMVHRVAGIVTIFALLAYLLWPSDSVLANPAFIGTMVLLFVGVAVVFFWRFVKFPGGSQGRTRPSRTGRSPRERDVRGG